MPLLVAQAAVATPAVAAQIVAAQVGGGTSSGRDEADALSRLFASSCFRHAGDAKGLRTALASPAYRPAPDPARLLARPGRAYRVDNQPGRLVVLSFDDGWCGDGGTGIDPHALTMRLAAAMQARSTSMRLMEAEGDGEQHYLLTRPAPAPPIVLLVLLQPVWPRSVSPKSRRSSGALMQASLFAAPLPPPGAAPGMVPGTP